MIAACVLSSGALCAHSQTLTPLIILDRGPEDKMASAIQGADHTPVHFILSGYCKKVRLIGYSIAKLRNEPILSWESDGHIAITCQIVTRASVRRPAASLQTRQGLVVHLDAKALRGLKGGARTSTACPFPVEVDSHTARVPNVIRSESVKIYPTVARIETAYGRAPISTVVLLLNDDDGLIIFRLLASSIAVECRYELSPEFFRRAESSPRTIFIRPSRPSSLPAGPLASEIRRCIAR